MAFTVLQPGLVSLLVDLGRPRSRHWGVPLGGAADRAAFLVANGLVGNSPDCAALEITLRGPTLRAEQKIWAVVFGAPFQVRVNAEGEIPPGRTFQLQAGDLLQIGGTPHNCRAYLAVAGGFSAPSILESRSSLEPILGNQTLNCLPSTGPLRSLVQAPHTERLSSPQCLRVLPGPQFDWFPDDTFFRSTYTVSTTSNRMGLRLTGPTIPKHPGEMTSEPVAPGAIQITNEGQPIILGVDGQTIGGYAKIAHVIRADLDRLGQLRPGDEVHFQRIEMEDAEALARQEARSLRASLFYLQTSRL